MVDGINTTDNKSILNAPQRYQTSSYSVSAPVNTSVSVPAKTAPMQQDQVIIHKRKAPDAHNTTNMVQMASLIVGGLASAALFVVLGRSFIPNKEVKLLMQKANDLNIPEYAKKQVIWQLRQARFSPERADAIMKYADNVTKLPFATPKKEIVDIKTAKKVLDEDLKGLDKVKDQVIKFLEVQNYKIEHGIIDNEPLILCLDGPPGVGKTSIANAIAKAMEKPFERISLAGVSNEPFIKGLKSYFVGAEPGQLIKAFQHANAEPKSYKPPVILLDEIDKMGSSRENGDPAAALIDALEPKQCRNFTDQYLQFPFDLSSATFVVTANDLSSVPAVLKNRMKMIHIDPYTTEVKTEICKDVKKKLMNSLDLNKLPINWEKEEEAIKEIVSRSNDQGARKTIENLKTVFDSIIVELRKSNYKKEVKVNQQFVANALESFKEQSLPEDKKLSLADIIKLLNSALKQ